MNGQYEHIITRINDGAYELFVKSDKANAPVYIRQASAGRVAKCTQTFIDKIMGAATWTIGGPA